MSDELQGHQDVSNPQHACLCGSEDSRPAERHTVVGCCDCGAPNPQSERVLDSRPPQIVALICDSCKIKSEPWRPWEAWDRLTVEQQLDVIDSLERELEAADAWDALTGEQKLRAIDTIDLPENMR